MRALVPAAQKVVDQPSNGGLFRHPTNAWFVDFNERHRGTGGAWAKSRVTKDVKRMRSTDRFTLEADIEELVGDAVTLGITDKDGRGIGHPRGQRMTRSGAARVTARRPAPFKSTRRENLSITIGTRAALLEASIPHRMAASR